MNTQTKSRKRRLLSSLAMLLVAMVALGSATYAWFTNQDTAKVDGVSVHVNAPDGLLISTDGTTWGNSITLSLGTVTLLPSSGFQNTDLKMYTASLNDGSVATITEATNSDQVKYYIDVDLQAKLAAGASSAKTLTVMPTVTVAGGDMINMWRIGYSGTNITKGIHANANTAYSAVKATGTDVPTAGYFIDPAETDYLESVTPKATTAAHSLTAALSTTAMPFKVRIWVEGQDAACTPAATLNNAAIQLDFAIA